MAGVPLDQISVLFHEMHDAGMWADSTTYELALQRVDFEVSFAEL